MGLINNPSIFVLIFIPIQKYFLNPYHSPCSIHFILSNISLSHLK